MGGRFPQPIKVIDHQGTESSFELFRDIDVNNRSRHNRSGQFRMHLPNPDDFNHHVIVA